MTWYTDSPVAAQTVFVQLLQTVVDATSRRSLAGLAGSFSSRAVKGRTYWYYQYLDAISGANRQIFLGPDSDHIRALVVQKSERQTKSEALSRLRRVAVASGLSITPTYHLRLIRQLADYGLFYAGGILIGSHAFAAYANMLGVRWQGIAEDLDFVRTLDVDFAHAGRNLSIALPSNLHVQMKDAIGSLEEGFVPLLSGTGTTGTWQHPRDPDYQIDFLTPQTDDYGNPFMSEQLGIVLTPLRFMEYSLEDVDQTVLFDRSSAVLVNVPNPARFAVHKLIIAGERKREMRLKAKKDILQAAALLSVLARDREGDLAAAVSDAKSRGPGWRSRLQAGIGLLRGHDVSDRVLEILQDTEQTQEHRPAWR